MVTDAAPAVQLYDPTGRSGLAPMGPDLVVWTGEQVARAELLALILAALLLLLLGLNLWLLIRFHAERVGRRAAERELYARLIVLEADRARRAAERGEGVAGYTWRGARGGDGGTGVRDLRVAEPVVGRGRGPGRGRADGG